MTNSLLVLGNGFDRAFGLKTGYKEFLASEFYSKAYNHSLLHTNTGLFNSLQMRNSLENWVDVELAIRDYALSVSKNSISDAHAMKIKAEFNNLKESLSLYLSKVLSSSPLNPRSSFHGFSEKISGRSLDVMSFNYTNTFPFISERMQDVFVNVNSVINIHGTLDERNIIFGIDGTASENIDDKITFLEKEFNINYQPRTAQRLLKEANEIYFFGVSLGQTDGRYYQPFFQDLLSSNLEKKIYFSFYGEDSRQYLYNRIKGYTSNQVHELKIQHEIHFYDCEARKFYDR